MQTLRLFTRFSSALPLGSVIALSLCMMLAWPCHAESAGGETARVQDEQTEFQRSSVSFLPTWRHMTPESKRQFIAGYVRGWTDASGVTDIAIAYLRDKPAEALSGLERLKHIYDLSDVDPAKLVPVIDRFYKDPQNSQAALSLAVSAARDIVRSGALEQ